MLPNVLQNVPEDIGHSSDLDLNKKVSLRLAHKTDGLWTGTSGSFRGPLKRKVGGKTTIHYHAEPTTALVLLRIIVSVNQLSVYGAIAGWCQDLAQRVEPHSPQSTGPPVANVDNSQASQVPLEVLNLTRSPIWNPGARGNLVRQQDEKFEHLPQHLQSTKACLSRTINCYHSRRSFGRIRLNKLMSRLYVSSK